MSYQATRTRVEDYFDRTATKTWERLTSDAPVSKIRETVRKGRDEMRSLMLSRLLDDLSDARVLDAGCGTGQMSAELAARGADVVGVDISPQLIDIAKRRLPQSLAHKVDFQAGDMLSEQLGSFDFVVAMDSLIYYSRPDLINALNELSGRTSGSVVFTVAPRTPLLMAMWYAGKLFPRSDRSPVMIPHSAKDLAKDVPGLKALDRVTSGFYISQAIEVL